MSDAGLPPGDTAFRGFTVRGRGVLQGDRFRSDLDYYDLVAQKRNEPGVVYLVQARFPRAMAAEMIRSVNAMWRDFEVTGPVSYTHLRAHETVLDLVCRLLLETKHPITRLNILRLKD